MAYVMYVLCCGQLHYILYVVMNMLLMMWALLVYFIIVTQGVNFEAL